MLRTALLAAVCLLLIPHNQGQDVYDPVPPQTLYISTLDGTFYALDVTSGALKWQIKEDKVVSVPDNFHKDQKFTPDPIDGSLYVITKGNVQKMQQTIPEMVNSAPRRTANGLLYAGKKTDYWVALNPESGDKHASMTTDKLESCTAVVEGDTASNLYVGKTEYSLTIVDSKTSTQTWNVTYVSYAAPTLMDANYAYTHYASSGDGAFLTFSTGSSRLLWHTRLSSPVISVFVERFGSLLRVPHKTLAADTIVSYIIQDIRDLLTKEELKNVVNCLFIGKYIGGIYAMNEIMHTYDVTAPRPRYPTIGDEDLTVKMIGRHVLPSVPDHMLISHVAADKPSPVKVTTTVEEPENREDPVQWYLMIAVVVIVILVSIVFIFMFLMFNMIRNLKDTSDAPQPALANNGSKVSKHTFSVGKIDVHLSDIIGHGSEGTVVFKGRFEQRDVAVKRVLLDFIDIDLHEVELLRQADEHPNVIRYFCMETDNMFRYLALEMCQASIREYVENTIFVKNNSQNKSLLFQTISGLQHLHSLNIVHRDIKPGNVLITKCGKSLKALISDFGLCRKISDGRQSVTARTGSAGTDGWIAPEMLVPSTKVTCAVDIFSYGCLMFYVLSGGGHPFGNDVYRRQNNILNYDYDLSCLSEATQDNVLAVSMIVKSVGSPDRETRPTANAISIDPYFWSAAKQLRFFSDVSDRVEKEHDSDLVLRWEHNCVGTVLRGGWMNQCPELEQDLYKYRKYKSDSVRDLLRAMRNKRHHYRELPESLKATLGDIPDGYMQYFSSRFPRLLLHCYTIMKQCKDECVFKPYYPDIFTFGEERLEMPHYKIPEPIAPRTPSRLALDTTGQYSEREVVSLPEPLKKKEHKKKRSKPATQPAEAFSWRKDNTRSNSESSDTLPSRRFSEFKPLAERKTQITDRKLEHPDNSNEPVSRRDTTLPAPEKTAKTQEATTSSNPETPWFEKFDTNDSPCVSKRKTVIR